MYVSAKRFIVYVVAAVLLIMVVGTILAMIGEGYDGITGLF